MAKANSNTLEASEKSTPVQQLGTAIDDLSLDLGYCRALVRLILDHGHKSDGFSSTEHGAVVDCLQLLDTKLLGALERRVDDLLAIHERL